MLKRGIKTEAQNYRPISLLPLISKVIVKLVHKPTHDYPQRDKLLYIYQSGYRANHFTDTCLSQIHLQNGFDFLDHKTLSDKIKGITFSDKVLFLSHKQNIFASLDIVFSKGPYTADFLKDLFYGLYCFCYISMILHQTCQGVTYTYLRKKTLSKEFGNRCAFFVDIMLSIYFGEYKTKFIFSSKGENLSELNITYDSKE